MKFQIKTCVAALALVGRAYVTFRPVRPRTGLPFDGGFHAAQLAENYRMMEAADLGDFGTMQGRQRILHWTGLPDVAPDRTALVPPATERPQPLTWTQHGFATPSDALPPDDAQSAVASPAFTRIRASVPDVAVPVYVGARRWFVPPGCTVAEIEDLGGGTVQSVARVCGAAEREALKRLPELSTAGDLDDYPDANPSDPGTPAHRVHVHFERPASWLKSLGAAADPGDLAALKAALTVAAFDRIVLV